LAVEKPGHDCPYRDVQDFDDLLILKVFYLLQDNHNAMFWRKLCKSCLEVLPNLSALIVDKGTGKR
jgi:hypothetical protein